MKKTRAVRIGPITLGGGAPLALIAGPCVIEDRKSCLALAKRLAGLADKHKIPLVFKASYDKANRSSHLSFRGPGLSRGLEILREVRERTGLPVLTDVHSDTEAPIAARSVDMLQAPAFLCRQTDLLLALGETGLPVNIKKGQFMAPWDMGNVIRKLESTGNRKISLTERGSSFGYNNLVADMRSLPLLAQLGYPVIFDATHSVQLPGGAGSASSGQAWLAPALARAAVAVGCDAVFVETHDNPKKALSDKDTMIPLSKLGGIWDELIRLDSARRSESKRGSKQ